MLLTFSFDDSDKYPLYFDVEKTIKINIKIYKETKCEDLLIRNHQLIQNKITDNSVILNSKNNYEDNKVYFVIISSEYPNTRIKLKPNDRPRKFLDLSKKISLYFIPIENKKNKKEIKKTISKSKELDNINKPKIINYVRPEDCIREGQLKKYNFKNQKFENRKVNVDKYKLIMSNSKNRNLWKVIYLTDIKTINKGTKNNQIIGIDDIFEITLSDNDIYTFKANNVNDMEEWYKVISSFVIQIKENNYLYNLTLINNNIMKEIFIEQINIIFNFMSLKGVLSLEKSRKVYFKFLNNYFLQKIIEILINYKFAINKKDYLQSFNFFKELMDLLDIKNFDLDNYHQKYNLRKSSKSIHPQNNVTINKDFVIKNMNSLKTIKGYLKIIKEFQDSKGNYLIISKNKNIDIIKKNLNVNTLNEIFDNILYSVHKDFHSNIVKNPDFLLEIKRVILFYLKPHNFPIELYDLPK
jgi:hypothetical protein